MNATAAARGRWGPSRLLNRSVVRAFVAAPSGLAALAVCAGIGFFAVFGPNLFAHAAMTINVDATNQQPSWGHLLGTDALGRDILGRILFSTRLSILLGIGATAIGMSLGVLAGAGAALVGGRLQRAALRGIDASLAFPGLLTSILVITIIGLGGPAALIGVGVAISPGIARLTSTLALSITGREYINAARVIGVGRVRLLLRYVLPNIGEPLILATSVAAARSIVTVSSLSFLGLGIQPPSFDWGRMLTDGIQAIYLTPAAALGPATAIAITALALGLAGEALARAMNPVLWLPGSEKPSAGTALGSNGSRRPVLTGKDERVAAARAELVLEVEDLVVTFPSPTASVDVVRGLSFSVTAGERIGIVGESGSGKTMTALAIARLTPFPGRISGVVRLKGQTLSELPPRGLDKLLGTEMAVVFQDPMSSLNPALTIGTQLTEGVRAHRGLSRRAASELAVSRLREVNMPSATRLLKRYPHEFSGGMRQRTMIAMGLMKEPSLLIADEPTTALDVTIQAQVMDVLDEVNSRHGTAIVLISHNLALVSQNCDRVLVMYAGRIVEDLPSAQLGGAKHPYTRALLNAVPEVGRAGDQPLEQIPGDMPDLSSPPPGCPFHPRCPLAMDKCKIERPPLVVHEDVRRVACWAATD